MPDDLAGRHLRVGHQGPGRRQRVGAAAADRQHVVGRLDHVAGPAQEQQAVPVEHDQHGFEPPQDAVGPPLLGQLGGGLGHRALVVAELRLEPLQQAEGVRRGPGEPGDDLAVVERADLLGVLLDDRLAERHLPVAADGGAGGGADGQDGSGAEAGHAVLPNPARGRAKYLRRRALWSARRASGGSFSPRTAGRGVEVLGEPGA